MRPLLAGMRRPFCGVPQSLPFSITARTTLSPLQFPLIVCPSAWPNRTLNENEWIKFVRQAQATCLTSLAVGILT